MRSKQKGSVLKLSGHFDYPEGLRTPRTRLLLLGLSVVKSFKPSSGAFLALVQISQPRGTSYRAQALQLSAVGRWGRICTLLTFHRKTNLATLGQSERPTASHYEHVSSWFASIRKMVARLNKLAQMLQMNKSMAIVARPRLADDACQCLIYINQKMSSASVAG